MSLFAGIEEAIRTVVENMKDQWEFRHHRAYLKKMGWTEEAYQKQTDPRVAQRAETVSAYYHGYQHLQIYDGAQAGPFKGKEWIEVLTEMNQWCEANCSGFWREDIHRVYEQVSPGNKIELHINYVGNYDVLIFAFENSKDYTMFCLRWGS